MRAAGWLACLACLALAAAEAPGRSAPETRVSSLRELTAALLAANRPEGAQSIVLTADIYIDGDLLRALPELKRDVAVSGADPSVTVMVDELVEVAAVAANVTLSFSGLTFRHRQVVGLGTVLAGLLDLGAGGGMRVRDVALEVNDKSMRILEGELSARGAGRVAAGTGRAINVSSLSLESVELRDSVFRTYRESADQWPAPLAYQVSDARHLVRHLRSGDTPGPLQPVHITLRRTIAVSRADMGRAGAVQLRRKVVICGGQEEGVVLLLANDLADGGFVNVSAGGLLVLEDLRYEFEAAVAPSATIGACGDPSCISTDTGLPMSFDQSNAVCRLVVASATIHTSCAFTKGLAKWLFLRQTAPVGARGASVVNHPGLAEVASLNAGSNESFNIRAFIGSGACVHESEITCRPIPIPAAEDAAGSPNPPEDDPVPEVASLGSLAQAGVPSRSDGVDAGEGIAIAMVCVAILSVVVIVSAVALRRRVSRGDDPEGALIGAPLAGCNDSGRSEATGGCYPRSPAGSPQKTGAGGAAGGAAGGEGSASIDKSASMDRSVSLDGGVSGGALMDRKWRELKEEMHKMNDDSVQLLELIGSGGYGVVYRGVWRGLPVAIKTVMFQDLEGKDSKQRRRAVYEAAISSSVVYPNVVQTYSYFFRRLTPKRDRSASGLNTCVDWKLYIVQEFCQLGSLLRSLKRGQFVDLSAKAPDMGAIVEVALGVARGMQHIHDHDIIHGDLTARNVLLQSDKSGSGYVAKVSDFGLSVKLDRYQNHISECYAGTPLYMAPELGMHGRLSKAADVYSFGIMLWELFHLSLQAPVSFSKVAACRKGPPRFSRLCPMPYALLCAVSLSPHPSDRPNFEQIEEILEKQLAMIRLFRFPKREDVEAFNSEWARGIVGLRPREALAYMMCNLPPPQPNDGEALATVDEESAGARMGTSMAAATSSSDPLPCSPIPNVGEEEEPFYKQDAAVGEGSRENLVEKKPPAHARRWSRLSGWDSREIQIEMGSGWDPKLGADGREVGVGGRADADKGSCSFSSSCTIEQTYSCDEQFMSVGWESRTHGQGHVDKGLNPMGLLNYKQVANCTRSFECTGRSQPGSKSCDLAVRSQQGSNSCEGAARSGPGSRDLDRRPSAPLTTRTTEESDYFSI